MTTRPSPAELGDLERVSLADLPESLTRMLCAQEENDQMPHESVTIRRDDRVGHTYKAWKDLAIGEPFTKVGSARLCGKVGPISYVAFRDVTLTCYSVSNPGWEVRPCVMTITWRPKDLTD